MKMTWGRRRTFATTLTLSAIALAAWIRCGAIPADLLDERDGSSTVVLDRHGQVLYERLSGAGTRRVLASADALPPVLVSATLAAEDRRFWRHPGVDPLAVVRAVVRDIRAGRAVEGASTITQQVAKLLIARREGRTPRGLGAKLREALLALRLEHRFSKRQILALYLSLASYGNQLAGAERASQAYFGCAASMLTPAQAAFLAALPQQPSRFNPYRDVAAARARQRAVLRRLREAGELSAAALDQAIAEHLVFARPAAPFVAPHFVEMVLQVVGEGRPPRIETTLDAGLQADVRAIIASHKDTLRAHGAANVAVVVLDNANAEWLAWEGSGDYFDAAHGGAINGALALRQPGSALKPLTYAAAFERGYSPSSVLPDVPTHFPTAEPGVFFSPRNYDGRYRGPLLARRALAGSENVPAVAVAAGVGVPALLRFFTRAGLSTFDRTASYYGLGITLGNAEVRLADLVSAYSAFSRGGTWQAPTPIISPRGARAGPVDLVSPRTAFWITDILSDADAREFIFGRGGALEFPFPVAVKTGTSQAYHDNWTIGYTRAVTVGVWVGNFDRTPLRDSSGVTGAAPIFHAVMLAAQRRINGADALLADTPVAVPPADLERVEICALSGMRATPACPARTHEWLPAGGERPPCSWHHAGDEGLLVVWPPEYRQWALQHGRLQDLGGRRPFDSPAHDRLGRGGGAADGRRRSTLSISADTRATGSTFDVWRPALAIANPPDGAIYSIDPTLRSDYQSLALRAVAASPGEIEWQVDGNPVGAVSSDQACMWPLSPGRHAITARDERGHTARTMIVVR
jgi:penicillin-binding protein 1C